MEAQMQLWMWLVAGGTLIVAEMLTVDLLFASLAFSAFAAAFAQAVGLDMAGQGAVFAVAAVISLFLLRPIALRNLKKRSPNLATNVDALIGAPALAMTTITDISGQVKLSGEIWSARTQTGSIPADARVEVVAIEGATAVVNQRG